MPRRWKLSAEEAAGTALTGADLKQWQRCEEQLKELGFEEEEANKLLRKAFGWAGQAFWRKSKVREVPSEEQVCPCLLSQASRCLEPACSIL